MDNKNEKLQKQLTLKKIQDFFAKEEVRLTAKFDADGEIVCIVVGRNKGESAFENSKDFSDSKEIDLEKEVTDFLNYLGFPINVRGYQYMRTAIILVIQDAEMMSSVTKVLYPSIAKKYETTPERVERAMRHAIGCCFANGNIDILNNIFEYSMKSKLGKPTNSTFISALVDRLNMKLKK